MHLVDDVAIVKFRSQAETDGIVAPAVVIGLKVGVSIAIAATFERYFVGLPEIGIATLFDSAGERHRRAVMVCTSDWLRPRSVAGEQGLFGDAALLQTHQGLQRFEGRTGRIDALYGSVQQRFSRIVQEHCVIFGALSADQQVGIPRRIRRQGQHLARSRFDGHNAAAFTLQQLLGHCLQAIVERQRQIFACHRRHIVGATFVVSLQPARHIAQHDFDAVLSAQIFFVGFFDTAHAGIIALTITRIAFNHPFRHFAYRPQGVRSYRIGITTQCARLNGKARETMQFFLQHSILFGRNLCHETLWCTR